MCGMFLVRYPPTVARHSEATNRDAMSFYDADRQKDFDIDLESSSDIVQRFHRTLMDRRHDIDWAFDATRYDDAAVSRARWEWSARAVAEYESTAQFAQYVHRLTLIGAPVELIGAATRLVTDECRHAELCARLADAMGGRRAQVGRDGLQLYDIDDLHVACALTVLAVCCFGETLSVPMFRALTVVTTDPLAARVATIIAGDEEYHARYGWEALRWFVERADPAQHRRMLDLLPGLMAHFERICHGSPDTYERLAGVELVVEEGGPNLGTLPPDTYAGIFYATMEDTILPQLDELGLRGFESWQIRPALESS